MATSQVTIFSFLCIIIHQTFIIYDPRRQHPSSNSKILGFHLSLLMPISVNKQELATIQETQSRKFRTSLDLYSHQKLILNMSQQKKMLKHYQEHSEFIFVKDTTISSSKSTKSHVKLFTNMQYENGFELLIEVVFTMIPQLGGLGPKYQDLFIPFHLGEGKTLPDFHLRDLTIRSEL